MKLHVDGTVEGTPEEIMKYQQLKPMGVKPLGASGIQQTPYIAPNTTITGTGPQIAYCDSIASAVK
ncbi:hypothetical protein A3842_11160 [Paenibacillus sp. P3E]|uniref:hypothetical protein n=1 Tax=Paenibacillus sp. P3E TaxID=1349435 RepID=UPI000938DA40|nr:hypothetical protein [Paenibacillus sp. P3E]OKP81630.1 hypothetical protein A3842_11160 [Paenibacillus sp. P3E]